MEDFIVKLIVRDDSDGTVLSSLEIYGKDKELILDIGFMSAFIYPDDLIRLGKWDGFRGFQLETEYKVG